MSANLLILVAVIYAIAAGVSVMEGVSVWRTVVLVTFSVSNYALAKL